LSARPALVVGANGLVGSRLVAQLAQTQRVIAVGRGEARGQVATLLESGSQAEEQVGEAALRPIGQHDEAGAEGAGLSQGVEYVQIDLLHPGELQDLIATREPEVVFHAAGLTDVDACERDPVLAYALNTRTFESAALGCREAGARLIALSTDYVFDGDNGPYRETDIPNPRGVYSRTKRLGEEAALLLNTDTAVCRVAVVFSGVPGSRRTFADGTLEALQAGKKVKAFHDQWVSPSLASSCAELCRAVWKSGQGGVFHCSGREVVDRVDFCRRLARKLGVDEGLVEPVALADVKLLAPRPRRCGLVVDKVSALGAHPLSVDEALDGFLRERGVLA
jgi:dTDP-4-dehydrorhamnose reductase